MRSEELSAAQKFMLESLGETFNIMHDAGEGVQSAARFVIDASSGEELESLAEEADKAWLGGLGIDPASLY